ncbi:MAG: hypothetical protein AAFQ38_11335 [Pseudomonadota bacterium]
MGATDNGLFLLWSNAGAGMKAQPVVWSVGWVKIHAARQITGGPLARAPAFEHGAGWPRTSSCCAPAAPTPAANSGPTH